MKYKYMKGKNLENLCQEQPEQRFSVDTALTMMTPIVEALIYLHQQEPPIVYRNVNPANIVVPPDETEAILVGFATTKEQSATGPAGAFRHELPGYAAIEQYGEGSGIDLRTDVYGLGATFYTLLTGVTPVDAISRVTMEQGSDPLKPISVWEPPIPLPVTSAVERAMSLHKKDRFATVEEFWQAMRANAKEQLQQDESPSAEISLLPAIVDQASESVAAEPLLTPISLAIDYAHQQGVIHGHLNPTNILLSKSSTSINPMGQPILSDFGTTQMLRTSSSPSQDVSFYSAPEQAQGYASNQRSDLYALGVILYELFTGVRPFQSDNPADTKMKLIHAIPTLLASFQPQPVPTPRKKPSRGLYIALIALLLVVVVGSGLVVLFRHPTLGTAKPIAGHAFFASSGLLSLNSSQGITDQLQLNLHNVPNPDSGKSYYAWLLNDKGADPATTPPISLGQLQVSNGTVNLPYPGTTDHIDLLANYGRILITQEDASVPPSNPSLDRSAWRYYAEFSAVPNPKDTAKHYSLLSHLRHLLSEDPTLKAAGLSGGLDIGLFRGSEKILEWSGSARDSKNPVFIRRQVIRILDYLDGEAYVGKDVKPGTPLLVDPIIARIPLLSSTQGQTPLPYVVHIGNHLREIIESPNVSSTQIALAIEINQAVNNVKARLDQVHKDALLLITMTNAGLSQPLTLSTLNDMTTQANDAFAGQIDPSTNQVVPGIARIHYNIQRLATFDITPCVVNGSNSCSL